MTCYHGLSQPAVRAIAAANPILADQAQTKLHYSVDHYIVDIAYAPPVTVESVRYWLGLFSHRRDGIWKGLLRVELDTPGNDAMAYAHLIPMKPVLP